MKIVHIITGLGDGGAEHTLFKICKYDEINKHVVISLKGRGKYFSLLKKVNTKVYCLNINLFFIHRFFFFSKITPIFKTRYCTNLASPRRFFGWYRCKASKY